MSAIVDENSGHVNFIDKVSTDFDPNGRVTLTFSVNMSTFSVDMPNVVLGKLAKMSIALSQEMTKQSYHYFLTCQQKWSEN